MAVIRSAQKQDFKFLSKIFSLNVPKYFDKKELNDFKKYFNSKNLESYFIIESQGKVCLLYTSPSPRDAHESRMPSSA